MFQARLQVAFRGMPWEGMVRAEDYYVSTHDRGIVNPRYWTDLVSPRSRLRMSVFILKRRLDVEAWSQVASLRNGQGNLLVDLALELSRQVGREDCHENNERSLENRNERSWKKGDERMDDVQSEGVWIDVGGFVAWGRGLLRREWISCSMDRMHGGFVRRYIIIM